MTHTVQLAVEHADHQTRYYPADAGWRIDAASRCIVVGRGLPRTHIPLDTVTAWRVEHVPPRDDDRVSEPAAPSVCATCGRQPPEGLLDTPWGPVCKVRCQIRRTGPHPPAESSDAHRIREQLLAELTGGKRPCPWCNGSPLLDSAEELLTHTRRHHLAPFPPDELVWLGDLSGYQLDADAGQVLVRHRCGWTYEVDNPVIAYLANLLDGPVADHRRAGCNPTEG